MALVLTQVVRVRVALVIDAIDLSVGQVYDEEAAAWADLIWIDLANSTVWPQEFGDAEFWAEVSALALLRSGITRPAVRLRAWRSGGVKADAFEILTSGSATANVAKVQRAGADITTDLPGLGPTLNTVRITGLRDQRVGWTGRMPDPIAWNRPSLAVRKRVRYEAASAAEQEYLSGVAGFAGSLAAFNGWLGANLPEFGSALTVGATVEFSRTQVSGTWTLRNKYLAVFTLHASLRSDAAAVVWTTRGGLLSLSTNDGTFTVCGGASVLTFIGEAFPANSANLASSRVAAHAFATTSGTFTTPAAGGGTITASPRGSFFSGGPTYGVDITLTITPQGRISAAAIAGVSSDGAVESVSGWGTCKMEGGLLA